MDATAERDATITSSERSKWVQMLRRVSEPVLTAGAANRLKSSMPVEIGKGQQLDRSAVTHLEAIGRTLAGIAPWLAVPGALGDEEALRVGFAALARQTLTNAVDPSAADCMDFGAGEQNLVDAAFLALGLSRARAELWEKLDPAVRSRLIAALQSTRKITPSNNNWLLFSALVEAFLASAGAQWRHQPIVKAFRAHEQWYKGDGAYGDGRYFHWDYYNSFVIHPMLIAILDLVEPIDARWAKLRPKILRRAVRYAAVQERLIAPDGSFPALGRSLTYRCGAFHHLADMALRRNLPANLPPAQVRSALNSVIMQTLDRAGTFDEPGWLRIGLAGHQPSLAEPYISTGSLYICCCGFLPLGLPPTDEFWTAPPMDWTSRMIWAGHDLPADHAIATKPGIIFRARAKLWRILRRA